jgi:hypothetical protein
MSIQAHQHFESSPLVLGLLGLLVLGLLLPVGVPRCRHVAVEVGHLAGPLQLVPLHRVQGAVLVVQVVATLGGEGRS